MSQEQMLIEGLGWRIGSDKPIEQVVLEAAKAYQVKHGVKPNVCLLDHRLADEPFNINGVVVVSDYPLAGHLLIGVANQASKGGKKVNRRETHKPEESNGLELDGDGT